VEVAVVTLAAAALDQDGAVILPLNAVVSAGEGEAQRIAVGHGRVTSGPARKREIGASPISEWTLRLWSNSAQACVASLSMANMRSATPSNMAMSRPSTGPQNASCLAF